MATDRAALRYVWATAGILAAGVAWYMAHVTVGVGTEAMAYVVLPAGLAVTTASVFRLLRRMPLEPVARLFWQRLLIGFALLTAGFGWLAGAFLVHYPPAGARPMPVGVAAVAAAGLGMAIWAVAGVPTG
ncbi:MAG TPA: hypothetical protein VH502_02910, partial [Actinoplanes sp.]